LSDVFNVRGIDWRATLKDNPITDATLFTNEITNDFDGFILNNNNEPLLYENSLGITRLSRDYSVLKTNKPKGICFKLQKYDKDNKITNELFEYIEKNIKGYFFVR
jgi:hypothetical protein